MGFEGNGKFRKYILQPRAHNSILPMSVDTLPLNLWNDCDCSVLTGPRDAGRHTDPAMHRDIARLLTLLVICRILVLGCTPATLHRGGYSGGRPALLGTKGVFPPRDRRTPLRLSLCRRVIVLIREAPRGVTFSISLGLHLRHIIAGDTKVDNRHTYNVQISFFQKYMYT